MIVCDAKPYAAEAAAGPGLASLADSLPGSCDFSLLHQYAFSSAQNTSLFYACSVCYQLSGLALGPVMKVCGAHKPSLALGVAGLLGAFGSAQGFFVLALLSCAERHGHGRPSHPGGVRAA